MGTPAVHSRLLCHFFEIMTMITILAVCKSEVQATLPIPDHVIYGTIAIQNKAVINDITSTNVVIEARRVSDGHLLASYRMGSSSIQGKHFYVLRVPMEDSPASGPGFAEPQDRLLLTIKRSELTQFTSTNLPVASGTALRIDFGPSVDTDGDGVPDGWEIQYFGRNPVNLAEDADRDGSSNFDEYVAGTSPVDPQDVFMLRVDTDGQQQVQVQFKAVAASGAGYEGRTRYYGLESHANANLDGWASVTNLSRLRATNQTIHYDVVTTNDIPLEFFRARVWLEGP